MADCMCLNCGKVFESRKISFDLTDCILSIMKMEIEEKYPEIEFNTIRGAFFSIKEAGFQIRQSEEEIYENSKRSEMNASRRDRGTYMFRISDTNIEEIRSKAKEQSKKLKDNTDKEQIEYFEEWIKEIQKSLAERELCLKLERVGDGDVKFDQISSMNGEEIKRVCPHCGEPMSFWAGRYPEIRLTVLGGPRVSKSTAMTACAYYFLNGRDPSISWSLWPNDRAYKDFKERYLDVYEKGYSIDATDDKDIASIPKISFQVTVGRGRKLCLSFVDIPGEWNGKKGTETADREYGDMYKNIDFVWYCTDPAEIGQLKGGRDVVEQLGGDDKRDIITLGELARNMSELASHFSHYQHKVPVAFILGKTDTSLISDDDKKKYGLFSKNDRENVHNPFDIQSFFIKSDKVKKYLMKGSAKIVYNSFTKAFPERCFIATSAYGFVPAKKDSGKPDKQPEPYHCAEAFYWMLAIRSCIDVKIKTKQHSLFGVRYNTITSRLDNLPPREDEIARHNLYMKGNYRED